MSENIKRILVIDDEDDVCQMIKEKFSSLNYEVLIAFDGVEGLRKTREDKPDCVLLDIRIPKGEDGLTYLRELRSYRDDDLQEQTRVRETPVIILTGAGASMRALFELSLIHI